MITRMEGRQRGRRRRSRRGGGVGGAVGVVEREGAAALPAVVPGAWEAGHWVAVHSESGLREVAETDTGPGVEATRAGATADTTEAARATVGKGVGPVAFLVAAGVGALEGQWEGGVVVATVLVLREAPGCKGFSETGRTGYRRMPYPMDMPATESISSAAGKPTSERGCFQRTDPGLVGAVRATHAPN